MRGRSRQWRGGRGQEEVKGGIWDLSKTEIGKEDGDGERTRGTKVYSLVNPGPVMSLDCRWMLFIGSKSGR